MSASMPVSHETGSHEAGEVPATWVRVATLGDIPPRGARVVDIGGCPVALFRTSADEVFALRDRCPHRGGPLSQGIVHGSCVTCPLHDWVIDLRTGEARGPDEGTTARYPVRLEGNEVWIGLTVAEDPAGRAGSALSVCAP